jgi:restriction system protein
VGDAEPPRQLALRCDNRRLPDVAREAIDHRSGFSWWSWKSVLRSTQRWRARRFAMTSASDLPKHDELFLPVVRALRDLGGSADNDQLVEKVTEILHISEELSVLPHKEGPTTEIGYRIAWVKSWLKWAAIVDNPQRGVWVLTERGRNAPEAEISDVPNRRRASVARTSKKGNRHLTPLGQELDVVAGAAEIEELADDQWQRALIDVVKAMEASAFERLARLLLLRLGFSHVEVAGRSGDGGIDLIGTVRINNVLSFRVLAQCKRYKETVGPGDIRNFRGAMQGRTDKGIFITSGRFTREARNEASRDGVPAIDLIDGESLAKLLKDLNMGVEVRMVERIVVTPDFFKSI